MNKKAFTNKCHSEGKHYLGNKVPKLNRLKNLYRAFTLAEVLITLTIIGVIAALTIPNLIQHWQQKELEVGFKRAYAAVSNGLAMIKKDRGSDYVTQLAALKNSSTGQQYTLVKELYEAMGGIKFCKTGDTKFNNKLANCGGQKYKSAGNVNNLYKTKNKKAVGQIYGFLMYSDNSNSTCFMLKNGVMVCAEYETMYYRPPYISFDTNGMGKGPNQWGYDLFTFTIGTNSGVLAASTGSYAGEDKTCLEARSGTSMAYGHYCGYYARLNKCPEDRSKTYFECLK